MIRDNYSLTVLENASLKSNNLQGYVPSVASRKESVPCLSPSLYGRRQSLVFLGLWKHSSSLCLCCHMASSLCMCFCPKFSLLIRTLVIGFRVNSIQCDLILTNTSVNTYFQIRTFSEFWGTYEFWQDTIQFNKNVI